MTGWALRMIAAAFHTGKPFHGVYTEYYHFFTLLWESHNPAKSFIISIPAGEILKSERAAAASENTDQEGG